MRFLLILLASIAVCLPFLIDAKESTITTSLSISPKHLNMKVGEEFSASIQVKGAKDLYGAPFYLVYEPTILHVISMSEGDFLKKDGHQTAFLHRIDHQKGRIIVGLARLGNVSGVDGHGNLATVRFKVLKSGHVTLSFQNIDFKNSRLGPIQVRVETASIDAK